MEYYKLAQVPVELLLEFKKKLDFFYKIGRIFFSICYFPGTHSVQPFGQLLLTYNMSEEISPHSPSKGKFFHSFGYLTPKN